MNILNSKKIKQSIINQFSIYLLKMPNKDIKVENLIRDYLLDEGLLKEKLSSPDVDFGFVFSFPPGPKSQNMSVFKPKSRTFIHIAIRIQLSKKHADALNSLKDNKKFEFFNNIRNYFIAKEVYFKIDTNKLIIEIIEQIFPDTDGFIPKNIFFKAVQKVFYCFLFSNLLVDDYCSGKEISSKKLGSGYDFSLYS